MKTCTLTLSFTARHSDLDKTTLSARGHLIMGQFNAIKFTQNNIQHEHCYLPRVFLKLVLIF